MLDWSRSSHYTSTIYTSIAGRLAYRLVALIQLYIKDSTISALKRVIDY